MRSMAAAGGRSPNSPKLEWSSVAAAARAGRGTRVPDGGAAGGEHEDPGDSTPAAAALGRYRGTTLGVAGRG